MRDKSPCPLGSPVGESGPHLQGGKQPCYLSPLPPGRQLVFFKTGWSHVVPDPNKTAYVRASG